MAVPPEPTRDNKLESLVPYVADRVRQVLAEMQQQGYDPVVYETRRSAERQKWLYGIGRTHHRNRKPVTWTLDSRHLHGKAVDIISKHRGWDWPEFFVALRRVGHRFGLHTIPQEGCHLEWQG